MSKTYILQKDLPGTKAGAKFTENYGDDTYEYNSDNGEDCRYRRSSVENNPEWFLPVENKSNDSFQWDDGYVELILRAATGNIKDFVMQPKQFIQDFKENWKSKPQPQKEEQRIKVDEFEFLTDGFGGRGVYWFQTTKQIHPDKFETIKQSIEQAVNGGGVKWHSCPEMWQISTQDKIDELCGEAFEEARKIDFSGRHTAPYYKYSNYQDYKQSKQ